MSDAYRAGFSADWHFSNRLPHAVRDPETLISDRLGDQMRVWGAMVERLASLKVEDLWIVGDLVDNDRLDAVVYKAVVAALANAVRRGLRVFLVPGNHEMHDAAGAHYILEGLSSLPGVTVCAGSELAPIKVGHGVNLWPLAARSDDAAVEIIRAANRKADPRRDFLVIHQQILGAANGTWIAPSGISPADYNHFGYVIAGHFHRPQQFQGGRYLGAPMQFNYGDAGEARGFYVATWSTDTDAATKLVWQAQPIRSPQFWEASWSGAAPQEIQVAQGDYLKLRLSGTRAYIDSQRDAIAAAKHSAIERGCRAVHVHLNVTAQTRERSVAAPVAGESLDWKGLLGAYVDAVDTTGFDRDALMAYGVRALEAAQGAAGGV